MTTVRTVTSTTRQTSGGGDWSSSQQQQQQQQQRQQQEKQRQHLTQQKREISRDYVEGLLGIGGQSSSQSQSQTVTQQVVSTASNAAPEHLREEKTEISEDGAVSEIVREVKSGPGEPI